MEDKELTFWEHLDVLRWAIVRIVCVWFSLAVVYFIAMPYIFDPVILGPCYDDFIFYEFLRKIGDTFGLTGGFFTDRHDIALQNINLAAPFFVHLSTSFILSVVTTAPYLFWEVWLFIRPALYTNESRGVKKALLLGSGMFYLGVAVGYFMVYPLTLRFLSTYNLSDNIETLISLNSYIDNFTMLILCLGLAFELPLVTWLLSLFGLITRSTLREYRRHAFVIIVIVGAIITPTGDPFTLMAVSLPLYALYELSILVIKDSKDDDDEESDDTPSPGTDGGDNGPDSDGQKNPTDNTPVSPDAEAESTEPKSEESIEDVFNRQREAAQLAKNEASNKALQERIDKAAAATAAATTAATTAEAGPLQLEAKTEPSVKEALAEAEAETKLMHMVVIGDEVYFEEYPDSKAPSAIAQTAETITVKPEATAEEEPKEEEAAEDAAPAEPAEEEALPQPEQDAAPSAEPSAAADDTLPASEETSASAKSSVAQDTQYSLNFDDPEAPPQLDNYYEEQRRLIAEEEAEEAAQAAAPAQEPMAETGGAEGEAASLTPSKPKIDISGIRYDFGRYGSR